MIECRTLQVTFSLTTSTWDMVLFILLVLYYTAVSFHMFFVPPLYAPYSTTVLRGVLFSTVSLI